MKKYVLIIRDFIIYVIEKCGQHGEFQLTTFSNNLAFNFGIIFILWLKRVLLLF